MSLASRRFITTMPAELEHLAKMCFSVCGALNQPRWQLRLQRKAHRARVALLLFTILFELGNSSGLSLRVRRRVRRGAVWLLPPARVMTMPLASANGQPGQGITEQRAHCAHWNTASGGI